MATAPRSSFRRELDKDLLWIDRNIGKLVVAVFLAGVILALATAKPGTPAAALAEVLLP